MSALARATLQRLAVFAQKGKGRPPLVRLDGPSVPVQLNPQSMKITRKNNVDRGGVTTGVQKRQHPSPEPSILAFDLEFDTAEQGETQRRVDVRDWTAVIRQFVEPPPNAPADAPPAVRFAWGTLVFDGIIQEVAEDLTHFAPDGTPLRAKVAVTITEQDFAYEKLMKGPATASTKGAREPGAGSSDGGAGGGDPLAPPAGTRPGSKGSARPDQVVAALAGESAQQLLGRLGLDPSAWRAAMNGIDSPLALPAGLPVQFGAEVESPAGVGAAEGFATGSASGSTATLAAALSDGPASAQDLAPERASPVASGQRIAAAGGIAAAAGVVTAARTASERGQAREAFAVPAEPAGTTAGQSVGQVIGLADAGDPRALTYGRGVPLRARAPRSPVEAVPVPARRTGDGGSGTLQRGKTCGGGCP